MGSMETPGGVLLWFSYCISGLILGLLVGTDLHPRSESVVWNGQVPICSLEILSQILSNI